MLRARVAISAYQRATRARAVLERRARRGGVVLLYHRVTTLAADPQLLAVTPQHFDEQVAHIAERHNPLPLGELVSRARSGRLPERAVALTFDDGYADNLTEAKPILERHGVPATVFVVTGQTGTEREFWWDELERLLLERRDGRSQLELEAGGRRHRFACSSADEREAAYRALQALVRRLAPAAIEAALRDVRLWAGEPETGAHRPTHRAMTVAELRTLVAGGLVEAGAHTVDHPSLGAQPAAVQREQVATSRRRLEQWLERPVTAFSYPFGTPGLDFTRATTRAVADAGFTLAAANHPGRVTRYSNRYALNRLLVRDWDGAELARRLEPVAGGS